MITSLPLEVQFNVVSHFNSIGDFARFGTVCKAWHVMQQSEHFWKIVAQKLGIPIPPGLGFRQGVIENYQAPRRIFQVMSQPYPQNYQVVMSDPATLRQFQSIASLQQDNLWRFLNTFHQVFQATAEGSLRKDMIRDLSTAKSPHIMFRLCRETIAYNFHTKYSLQLHGTIEVHLLDLNEEECAVQNGSPFPVFINYLNRWLKPLNKIVNFIGAPGMVAAHFDVKEKVLEMVFPQGLFFATRPPDLIESLADLKDELEFLPHCRIEVLPCQRLVLIEIPDDIIMVFRGFLHSEDDIWHWVLTLFSRYQLRLHSQGQIWVNFDPISESVTVCSHQQILVSKFPVESEC